MHWLTPVRILFKLFTILLISLGFVSNPASAQNALPSPDETAAITTILDISKQQQAPGLRGQHPKGHGVVWAEFTVAPDLPADFRVGVLKEPGKTFPAWIRFSNARGMDDTEPGLHGMAVKLMDVEGEKVLEGEETAPTQDFVMLDHPVFFIRNAVDFAQFFTALSEAAGRPPLKFFIPNHLREFKIVWSFRQNRIGNPLATCYWSTTPSQFGQKAAKFAVRPTSQIRGEVGTTPDYLRTNLVAALQEQDATFDFLIQLQTDPKKMPVEDPTVEWREQDAPMQKVATIRIPRQVFDTPEQNAFGEALSFTPWHSLPEHQPLGSINRARKVVYQAMAEQRHQTNPVAYTEPSPETFTPKLLAPEITTKL